MAAAESSPNAPRSAAGFPRSARLRKPGDFKQVAAARKRLRRPALTLSFSVNARNAARLGLAIAKKAVPNASDRNRIKRLIREDFRQHVAELPAVDIVFHAQPGAASLAAAELRAQLADLRAELIRQCRRRS